MAQYIKGFFIKQHLIGYPFLELIENADNMTFDNPVSIFCGENGSGKSTFAKILATSYECVFVAPPQNYTIFKKNANAFGIRKFDHPQRSFYFSAEDFISFVLKTEADKTEAEEAVRHVRETGINDNAAMPYLRALKDIERYGNLGACSHGEGFLRFFNARLVKNGLYIIDEPEAALSSENQYILAYQIHHAARELNCQFIICTHSPIIAAIPNADLYEIHHHRFERTEWERLANVSFLKMFLQRKEQLFEDNEH